MGRMEVFARQSQGKDFYFLILRQEGGEYLVAFSKQHKNEMLKGYEQWLKQSQAVFVLEYKKMGMKDVDSLRNKVRDAGGQLHVVKNTLMGIALDHTKTNHQTLEGTSLMAFAINDVPALAKVFLDVTKNSEVYKLKGGYMDGREIKSSDIKMLAELPPLPVMRAKLLGLLQAPASKLVRTINEPARSLAFVVKAYSQHEETVPAEA
jgi:large subunit ribosomal protein L10